MPAKKDALTAREVLLQEARNFEAIAIEHENKAEYYKKQAKKLQNFAMELEGDPQAIQKDFTRKELVYKYLKDHGKGTLTDIIKHYHPTISGSKNRQTIATGFAKALNGLISGKAIKKQNAPAGKRGAVYIFNK
jgi:hypothetical protein